MTLAIVPVKSFERAKSRLAEILSPAERRALARAMLTDVFDTLKRAKALSGAVVVTCDAEARAMGAALGFETIEDEEAGINAAAALGLRHAARRGESALVTPGDIPFLADSELRDVLSALETAPVVIVPATRDGGTNLLAMAPADLLTPAFGPDSAARHLAMARARGLAPAVLRLQGAGRDIDVPVDLTDLGDEGAPQTRACLARIGVRLSLYERISP